MTNRTQELMAEREPSDMPSPWEFRDAFDADIKKTPTLREIIRGWFKRGDGELGISPRTDATETK